MIKIRWLNLYFVAPLMPRRMAGVMTVNDELFIIHRAQPHSNIPSGRMETQSLSLCPLVVPPTKFSLGDHSFLGEEY